MDGVVTEFAVPTAGALPYLIAPGPDGAMWFTEYAGNKIGRITMDGVVTEFAVPTAGANPAAIATGPDKSMWFTEFTGNKIGRITMAGAVTEYAVPTGGSVPVGIAAGPDKAMWFTEYAGTRIGRISMAGRITEHAVPTAGSVPFLIATGPDGAMWFTERIASRIASIGTRRGTLVTASVIGRAAVGSTLRCAAVNDSGWTVASTSRTWLRNGAGIPGATGQSYVVKGSDAGKRIACRAALTFSPALNQLAAQSNPRLVAVSAPRR